MSFIEGQIKTFNTMLADSDRVLDARQRRLNAFRMKVDELRRDIRAQKRTLISDGRMWRGDWNLSTVLQDEAGGASTGGTLYLTNIHRLYDTSKRRKKESETYDWAGPAVSKAKALDTGAELRKRITSHDRVMVLNDEAHHVWDPESAWNEAIEFVDRSIRERAAPKVFAPNWISLRLPRTKGWHAYRRGLATNLHELGVPDKVIQAILRHEDVSTTQRSYIKTVPQVVTDAMNQLAAKIARAAVVQQVSVN